MKNLIYRFLVLCAGSDEDILRKCPRSEHIKHAGFGALVLVPATLALYSMTYAISTFVENQTLYILAGLTWGGIVLLFDRFIVSTLRKKDSVLKDAFSFTFASRLVFSIFVGIVIAHPLVLLYFHNSIDVELDKVEYATKDSILYNNKVQKDAYRTNIDTLDRKLKGIQEKIDFQERLIQNEVAGEVRGDNRTTGEYGQGPAFQNAIAYRDILYQERNQLIKSNTQRKLEDSLEIVKLDTKMQNDTNRLTFSRGYLDREKALSKLSGDYPIINVTTWFLILFFIFVDILPVTWKVLTNRGPYDDYLNEVESKVNNEIQENKADSDAKLAMHKRHKERDIIVHSAHRKAEENANNEFSDGELKDVKRKVLITKELYKSNAEINNEILSRHHEFCNRIRKSVIEFREFQLKMIDEIETWKDEDLKRKNV